MSTSLQSSVAGQSPLYAHPHAVPENDSLRTPRYTAKRRHWPGILAATVIGAGIAAAAVSSYYDSRSVGERLDATVAAVDQNVQQQVSGMRSGATEAARGGALATERAATALGDAGITAAVKTSLAADPSLSAVKINVSTVEGVVVLSGPAPDQKSHDRAAVLAAAPQGVVRVDIRLVVGTPAATPAN